MSLRGAKEVGRSLRSAAGAKKEAGSRKPADFSRTLTKCRIVPSAITRRISPSQGKSKEQLNLEGSEDKEEKVQKKVKGYIYDKRVRTSRRKRTIF